MANIPPAPFERVVVIRGPAGSGKTMLIRALIDQLNKDGYAAAAIFERGGIVCHYPVDKPFYDVLLVQDVAIPDPLAKVGERGMVLVYTITLDAGAAGNMNPWYNPKTVEWLQARVDDIVFDLHL